MPSISIDFPQLGTPVGNNFDAGGTFSLDFVPGDPAERAVTESLVECWMTVGTDRYDAETKTDGTDWYGIFSEVPAGNGYVLHARLNVGNNYYDAPDVTGLGVVRVPGGHHFTIAQSGGRPAAKSTAKSGAKDAKSAAAAASVSLTAIHVHHRVSLALEDDWPLTLRSISAAYVDRTGHLLTRVFDGKINVQDGDFEIHMNLRRALGEQGSIKARAELWPNLVVPFLIQTHLIVVDD